MVLGGGSGAESSMLLRGSCGGGSFCEVVMAFLSVGRLCPAFKRSIKLVQRSDEVEGGASVASKW